MAWTDIIGHSFIPYSIPTLSMKPRKSIKNFWNNVLTIKFYTHLMFIS